MQVSVRAGPTAGGLGERRRAGDRLAVLLVARRASLVEPERDSAQHHLRARHRTLDARPARRAPAQRRYRARRRPGLHRARVARRLHQVSGLSASI